MITLAVDAMGGDAGLSVTVPGAVDFLRQQNNVHLIMVGNEVPLRAALASVHAPMERITVLHAAQVVEMDESPQLALKNKKDSSMRLTINQVKEGSAQAAVSAGNTGALMAMARFVLKTIPGIERPAIAKFIPSAQDRTTLMLDLGANVDCTEAQLMQFAVVGSELYQALYPDIGRARVGLLNMGTEDMKGTEVVKRTFRLLKESNLNFVGNVEGNEVFSGGVDVVVSDGFVGNIVLKAIEGTAKFMGSAIKQGFEANVFTKAAALVSLPVLNGFKRKFDPRRFNGAIFLGLRGVVVKSHGGADTVSFTCALAEAYHEAYANSLAKIEQGAASQLLEISETGTGEI